MSERIYQLFSPDDSSMVGGQDLYFVAELSANHAQDLDIARRSVRKAAECGADAIKLQTYKPDTMTLNSTKEPFKIQSGSNWDGQTLYELYDKAQTPWDWHAELQQIAHDTGIDFFSTAFDESAVEFLEDLDVPVHKVASFEIVHTPLLRKMARTGKPLIISTGMASLREIERALNTVHQEGCEDVLLLKCTSSYPAKYNEMDLATIPHMSDAFNVPVGLSDHSIGHSIPITAVTLGAILVEKHFTLSRDLDSPDAEFSMLPGEFETMVQKCKQSVRAKGDISYGTTEGEEKSKVFRRSIFTIKDISKGEVLSDENIAIVRPGNGLNPHFYDEIVGVTVQQNIEQGTPLDWSHLNETTGMSDSL